MRQRFGCLFAVLLALLAMPSVSAAQSTTATHITTSGTLPAHCRVGDLYQKTGGSAGLYFCSATDTWTAASGATGPAGADGSLVLLEQHTASSSATLDFTTCFSSTYDDYLLRLIHVTPATAAQNFVMRVSTDGGSTFDSSSNYYMGQIYVQNGAGTGVLNANPDSALTLFTAIDNTTSNGGVSGSIDVIDPLSTSVRKGFIFDLHTTQATLGYRTEGFGVWNTAGTAINAVRFLFASGNIATGTIRCYGLEK